jgi:phosphoglycerate kinase
VTAPDKPFIVLLGGDDVLGAVDLATSLLGRADVLLIGGGVANTFVAAMGERVGASAVQRDALALVRTLLEKARDAKVKVLLPTDVVVAGSPSDAAGRPTSYGTIAPPEIALDIGPATLESFSKALLGAGTILVTGPMGFADNPAFAKGTRAMADAVANAAGYTVAVGDGATAVTRAGDEIAARLGHVSKGGRAAVALVSGKKLPGVEALRGA